MREKRVCYRSIKRTSVHPRNLLEQTDDLRLVHREPLVFALALHDLLLDVLGEIEEVLDEIAVDEAGRRRPELVGLERAESAKAPSACVGELGLLIDKLFLLKPSDAFDKVAHVPLEVRENTRRGGVEISDRADCAGRGAEDEARNDAGIRVASQLPKRACPRTTCEYSSTHSTEKVDEKKGDEGLPRTHPEARDQLAKVESSCILQCSSVRKVSGGLLRMPRDGKQVEVRLGADVAVRACRIDPKGFDVDHVPRAVVFRDLRKLRLRRGGVAQHGQRAQSVANDEGVIWGVRESIGDEGAAPGGLESNLTAASDRPDSHLRKLHA